MFSYITEDAAEHRQTIHHYRKVISISCGVAGVKRYKYSTDVWYKHLLLAVQGLRDWQRCRLNNDWCWQQQRTAVNRTAAGLWLHHDDAPSYDFMTTDAVNQLKRRRRQCWMRPVHYMYIVVAVVIQNNIIIMSPAKWRNTHHCNRLSVCRSVCFVRWITSQTAVIGNRIEIQ